MGLLAPLVALPTRLAAKAVELAGLGFALQRKLLSALLPGPGGEGDRRR